MMDLGLVTFALTAVASVVAAAYTLFFGVRRYQCSLFRYKLWEVRDEVWDGLRRGQFDNPLDGQKFVTQVETKIRAADDFTISNAILASVTMGRARRAGVIPPEEPRKRPVSPELVPYEDRVAKATIHYLLAGSVLGWAIAPAVGLSLLIGHLSPRHRDGPHRPDKDDGVDARFADVVANYTGRVVEVDPERQPLSHCL